MRILLIALLANLLAGCFNPSMLVDKRTALEQELTRSAIDRTIKQLPIIKETLEGRWKISIVSANNTDASWTYSLLREHLVGLGVDINHFAKASDHTPVIEAVVQYAGSDIDNFILGVPIPGSMGTSSLSFYHDNGQRGRARLYLNFWTADGKLIAQSPHFSGETHYTDITFFLFIGPFSFTDLDDVATYGRIFEKVVDKYDGSIRTIRGKTESIPKNWIVPQTIEKEHFWSKYIKY